MTKKDKYLMISLHTESKKIELIKQSGMVVARGYTERLVKGYKLSFMQDEYVLEA